MRPDEPNSEADLVEKARRWAEADLDRKDRLQIIEAIQRGDLAELERACAAPLEFGTAGLRGEVGPGPGRMNRAVVARVSWALGLFLTRRSEGTEPLVVVGFDARPDSRAFARDASEILTGIGVRVVLSDEALPTPVFAYAVRWLEADAAVVVTASHNPRPDNGFKVFDDQGVQIVAPWDTEVAALMGSAPPANSLKRGEVARLWKPDILDAYSRDVIATADFHVPNSGNNPSSSSGPLVIYTPLHGVGLKTVERVLAEGGAPVRLHPVAAQAMPDGTFPTVEFPNPEEPGALDLALDEAERQNADVVCANDPDADRLAVCLPLGDTLARLSGDALGLLFADACLRSAKVESPTLLTTVVSSPALEVLVAKRGGSVVRTLTGFKWLCHAALEMPRFAFAYEEALGYCFAAPDGHLAALDKDGVLALYVFARLLGQEGGGQALGRRLLEIYREVGLWGSFGASRRFEGAASGAQMQDRLSMLRAPGVSRLGGLEIESVTDYALGAEHRPWYLGHQELLQFDLLADDPLVGPSSGRVLVRPSGTEPKLKLYIHLRSDFPAGSSSESLNYEALSRKQQALAERIATEVFDVTQR